MHGTRVTHLNGDGAISDQFLLVVVLEVAFDDICLLLRYVLATLLKLEDFLVDFTVAHILDSVAAVRAFISWIKTGV